jgi:hypothetical protein
MGSMWRRTAAQMLITGYTVVLRNQTGMTTRQVKFRLEDYLGATVSQGKGGNWTLELFHGTTRYVPITVSSESAGRQRAKKWMMKKLLDLRAEYKQAESWVVADPIARGYELQDGVHL